MLVEATKQPLGRNKIGSAHDYTIAYFSCATVQKKTGKLLLLKVSEGQSLLDNVKGKRINPSKKQQPLSPLLLVALGTASHSVGLASCSTSPVLFSKERCVHGRVFACLFSWSELCIKSGFTSAGPQVS